MESDPNPGIDENLLSFLPGLMAGVSGMLSVVNAAVTARLGGLWELGETAVGELAELVELPVEVGVL